MWTICQLRTSPTPCLLTHPYSPKAKNTLCSSLRRHYVCRPVNFEPVGRFSRKLVLNIMLLKYTPDAVLFILPSFITRQAVYLQRNTESRSCNHCCCGKSSKCYIFWVCVCSLSYPSRNARAPYYHLWPARLYNIFPHYLINGTIFEKKKGVEYQSVFRVSLQLLLEVFVILRRIQRGITNVY
jgi:hypothetical protein